MKRHSTCIASVMPALTLLLASCTADKIEVPEKELYTREFIKQFGTFSSDAGWNSAIRVQANIDPSVVAGGTDIKVFTAWPTSPDCRIVASFPASAANFEFDYPDGLEYAYVQVLDANGNSLYGAYTRITDRQLNVGGAGRGSRVDEPTGGSHYSIYTYDLTNNPALGTFLVDESYNREFWKGVEGSYYSEKTVMSETKPGNIDTSTITTLFNGSHNLDQNESGGWNKAFVVDANCSYFKSSDNNHFEVTVTGTKNNTSNNDTPRFMFQYQTNASDEWNGFGEGLTPGELIPNIGNDGGFSITAELHGDDVKLLRQYPLAIKGTNLTITGVSVRGLEYETSVPSDPTDIDTKQIYTVNNSAGYPFNLSWNKNDNKLSGLDGLKSNRAEITIKYKTSDIANNSEYMFVLKDMNDKDIVVSGALRTDILNEDEEYIHKFYLNGNQIERFKNGGYIGGTNNIRILSMEYRNLDYVQETTGGTAKFSDLFNLYGLTTAPGVTDMTGYKNHALKPYNDYDLVGYTAHDLVSIVGSKTGVFHEEVNANGQCNLLAFRERLKPDAGVDYILEQDGEVLLDYFFGCASTFNSFGYFYYTEAEANLDEYKFVETLLKKPKFLLIYRAFPHSNIMLKKSEQEGWGEFTDLQTLYASGGIVTSGDDEGKDMSDGWKHCGEFTSIVDKAESDIENGTAETNRSKQYPRFRSANYRLVYYSPDQFTDGKLSPDARGSYIFPKGTHIAFFVINGGQYALQREGSAGFKIDQRRISFSRPLLNKYLGNVFNALGHSHSALTSPSTNYPGLDAQDMWTPFVTYKWGGDIVMGVEDYFARTQDGINGGDHDMNDMLFRVKGDFVRDREELNPNTPMSQNWIIACEDLGGTHDFDFNDVVFGVTHVAGEQTATVTALASGGTLPVYLESIYQQTSHSSSGITREDGCTYYTLTPEGTGDGEFHKWWGPDNHHSGIINADRWSGKGAEISIQVGDDFTLSDVTKTKPGTVENGASNMGGFRVRVHRNDKDYVTISAPVREEGVTGYEAPQMFLVPHTWNWPVESQFILDVYPYFNNWNEGVDWWTKPHGKDGHNIIRHYWSPSTAGTNK